MLYSKVAYNKKRNTFIARLFGRIGQCGTLPNVLKKKVTLRKKH